MKRLIIETDSKGEVARLTFDDVDAISIHVEEECGNCGRKIIRNFSDTAAVICPDCSDVLESGYVLLKRK